MSVQHAAVHAFVVASGRGRRWRSADALDAAIARRAPWPSAPPRPGHGVDVAVREDDGWPVVELVPRDADGAVLALHGGGYVFGPEPQHWTFWRRIAVAARRRVVVPLYRLAPEGTAGEIVPRVARLAEERDAVGIVGDSAGGGMALAAAQLLAARDRRPALLLSAPWLDGTMRSPDPAARDPWLAAPGLRRAADLYRGELSVEHPFVSPLLGPLDGLGPIVAASGTRDVLHRDALRLEASCPTPVRVLTGEGMLHNYPLLPIPEARPALRAFVDALR